ncbi:multidrug resistance-associated protein [Pochonia chlamydosporia 170]|uniref:Multidrug resistance-associated protein n=1 Tax=Pochonia chlamydosporia 170 TaxID=1380566 RepID=A0A179FLM9_METCM|nr:multidrug resistance-associated protein [Pochonia chlamydosporia 170]OAQ66130.2 multidrug resistance-associated protein [Pochonia chlamydosporia 170]
MSANNKWPDFRLASTLRSLMGSQPDEATDTRSSRQSAQKQRRDQPEQIVNDSSNSPSRDDAADAMANEDNNSIAGSEASAAGADEDFGAIEMFDSNAAPATFSSQAPVAVMSEDAPVESSTKKSKRDKKDKRDKKRKSSQEDVAAAATSPIPEEEDSSRKHRKSKRRSHKDAVIPDSQPSQDKPVERSEDTPWGQLQEEEAAAASSQSKKKRKLSDSVDGKGRKKRRSHDQESEDQDGAAAASGFLRKRKEKRGAPESAIYENEEPESDPQKSPTVEHLRRRSQSREARSRENSVPAANQMDVDQEVEDPVLANVAALAEADGDVERLAREAWNEHRNGQQALEEQQNGGQDTEMPDQYPQEPLNDSLEGIAEAEPSSAKSKKTRSSRKKAKPTYFEQDPIPDIASDEEGNRNALGELPSPSAATPKARRAKRAAKKESRGRKPKREKLSQSIAWAASADADGEFGQSSKNRLTGFTQGRFTDAELARIARAVESYRAEHEITQREVNDLIHAPGGTTAGETHAQLWSRIFAECPDRHRQKVINITRKKFHNFVARGTWTTEQDAELAELIQLHGTKWSYIASLINRHPEDLRDRYRNYIVCGPNQRKDAWDENEEARLTQHIIESMMAIDELRNNHPSRALLQKSYEELIDWQNISELMGRTRSRLQCITKWKSLNIRTHGRDHLVSSQPDSQISFRLEKARRQIAAMPGEERYRLVLAIQATAVGTDVKIPWQRLVDKPFRNQWHRYTQMLLWRRLKQTVPSWETISVRDCAQYLIDHYNQAGELPDVPDEQFDDMDEMQYMQAITPMTSFSGTQEDGRGQVSAEFVTESDAEDNHAEANGETEEQPEAEQEQEPQDDQDEEMNIDPALAEIAQAAKKATPVKRATEKAARKRGRKSAAATEDPIEEDAIEESQQAQEQEPEAEVEQPKKKKKTPKSKTPRGRKGAQQSSPVARDADSGMDDMEDLPARVAVL